MTIQVGDTLYQVTQHGPDSIGQIYMTVVRREVLDRGDKLTTLSSADRAIFPTHSPPEAIEDAYWEALPGGGAVLQNAVVDGPLWSSSVTLPTEAVIDEGAAFSLRARHRMHTYVNRESGKPAPVLDQADALLLAIIDWRDPR